MTPSARLAALVAVPPVAAAVLWATVLAVTAVTGQHPVWRLEPRNLPEAAALRDGAAVVRFIERGQDLNAPADLRPEVMRSDATSLTALEAAAIRGEREMLLLLLDLGPPSEDSWHRAFCASDDEGIREVLAPHRPPGAVADCAAQ